MKRSTFLRRAAVAAIVSSLLAALILPGAGAANTASMPAGSGQQTVFVELTQAPVGDISVTDTGAQAAKVAQEQADFRKAARNEGIKLQERYAYSKLFNGFSVMVRDSDLPRLARLPQVQNIYPVVTMELPELHSSTDMIRAPEVVADGYDGSGVKVAVIDTGIDYSHPDLGGCFGVGCRVMRGYDFVGDDYMGPGTTIMPDPDPMDQNGHGTHVSGIIGARAASDQGVTGVAPGVTFFAYKVFGADGPTSSDIIVAALEAAYADGADVINMSLGASFQWPRYPTAVAADRLVQKGVVVSVSAGNSGTNGLFAGGAPSVASRVLAVASYDNTMVTVLRAELAGGGSAGYGIMTFSAEPFGQSFEAVAVPNLGNSDSDYDGLDVTGKLAIVSRGADTFANKVARAQRFGAAAVIVHNNSAGYFAGTLGTPTNGPDPWIYAMSMSREDGALLRARLASGPVTITFTDEGFAVANPTAGQVSSFSSWGPSPDLDLKPDLGAPGGMIYSTYPMAYGGYASLSGTSMAAPHVSGAAALVIQANPRIRAQQLHDILRNTAVPRQYQSFAHLWPVNRQGAGMIDVLAAVSTPVRISPAKLSMGEFETETPAVAFLTLTNTGRTAATYSVSHTPALSSFADYPNSQTVRLNTAAADVTLSHDSVTIPARSSATIRVTVAPPADGFQGLIFGGYVTFQSDDGLPPLNVPYVGYQGDYQADPVLDFSAYGMPWLAMQENDTYYRMENMEINPTIGQEAYVLVNLARQAAKLRLTARATRGRNAGRVYDLKFAGRHADPTGFTALAWDGRDPKGNMVPQGDYVLILEVLKPLGVESNPDHWERWTSGPITVRYR